jgi:hypothetical protein
VVRIEGQRLEAERNMVVTLERGVHHGRLLLGSESFDGVAWRRRRKGNRRQRESVGGKKRERLIVSVRNEGSLG